MKDSPFAADEAAGLANVAITLLERIEDRELDSRRPSSPLPRGVFSCGEAEMIIAALLVLLAHVHPEAMPNGDVCDLAQTHLRRLN